MLNAICLGVVLAVSAAFFTYTPTPQQRITPATITLSVTEIDQEGNSKVLYSYVRYISSNGSWRMIRLAPDGSRLTDILLDTEHEAQYRVDDRNKTLELLQRVPKEKLPADTAESLRQRPEFLRTESVIGYTAYVLHQGKEGDYFIGEYYRVPEFGPFPIKSVTTTLPGKRRITGPSDIKFGEPDPSLFDLSGYKVVAPSDPSKRSSGPEIDAQ